MFRVTHPALFRPYLVIDGPEMIAAKQPLAPWRLLDLP
jgi:hypothetical protein